MEEWHDWLVHGSIPRNVSWLSESVSITSFMVLMVHWLLSISPLSMGIWHWWVLWQDSGKLHPEHVWVVEERSHSVMVVVENDWSLMSQTSTSTSGHVSDQVDVYKGASGVETLDWQLSNDGKSKRASDLSSGDVAGHVPVGFGARSCEHLFVLALWEPRLEDCDVLLGLWGPAWKPLFDLLGRETEADKVVVLNVVWHLVVDHSSLSIIEGILIAAKG